jgi:hypothetical protein
MLSKMKLSTNATFMPIFSDYDFGSDNTGPISGAPPQFQQLTPFQLYSIVISDYKQAAGQIKIAYAYSKRRLKTSIQDIWSGP